MRMLSTCCPCGSQDVIPTTPALSCHEMEEDARELVARLGLSGKAEVQSDGLKVKRGRTSYPPTLQVLA